MPDTEQEISVSNARFLRGLMTLMFHGQDDVRFGVKVMGWKGDRPPEGHPWIGAEVHVRGWFKRFHIPTSMVKDENVRAILDVFATATHGALLMHEESIQLIEGMVH